MSLFAQMGYQAMSKINEITPPANVYGMGGTNSDNYLTNDMYMGKKQQDQFKLIKEPLVKDVYQRKKDQAAMMTTYNPVIH